MRGMDEDESRQNPYAEPVMQQAAAAFGVDRSRVRLASGWFGTRLEVADEQGRWPAPAQAQGSNVAP